mgnify:CR=1 FL=1
MSNTQKQLVALQKRVSAIETQLKQDANLSEIREMLADIVKTVKTPAGRGVSVGPARAPETYNPVGTARPASHILQTRFRAL